MLSCGGVGGLDRECSARDTGGGPAAAVSWRTQLATVGYMRGSGRDLCMITTENQQPDADEPASDASNDVIAPFASFDKPRESRLDAEPANGVSAGIRSRRIAHLAEQASLVTIAITVPIILSYLLLFRSLFQAVSSYGFFIGVLTAVAAVALIIRLLVDERSIRRLSRKFLGREISFFGQWGVQLPTKHQGKRKIYTYLAKADGFTKESIAAALAHLVSPGSLNRRTGHSIVMEGDYYNQKIIKRVELPASLNGSDRIIPAIRLRKASPVNDLSFKFGDKRTSAVPSGRGQGLIAYVLSRQLHALTNGRIGLDNAVWLSILSAVISEYPKYRDSRPDRRSRYDLGMYLDLLQKEMSSYGVSLQQSDQFVRLVEELCEDWVIWVIAPETDDRGWQHLTIEYKTLAHDRTTNAYERLRTRLGLQHRNMTLVMPLALETQRYHLDLSVPNGMYLYNVKLALVSADNSKFEVDPDSSRNRRRKYRDLVSVLNMHYRNGYHGSVRSAKISIIALWMIFKRHWRKIRSWLKRKRQAAVKLALTDMDASPMLISSGLGASFVHVYAREIAALAIDQGVTEISPMVPVAKLEFRERPPGNIAIVMLLSVYITSMAWVIARMHEKVLVATQGGSPWSTIIFGTPARISAWVVSRFVSGNASRASLVTAAVIAWAVLNSVAVVSYVAVVQGGARIRTLDMGAQDSFPWIFHPQIVVNDVVWVLVSISCMMHLVLTFGMYASRNSRFMSRLRMSLTPR